MPAGDRAIFAVSGQGEFRTRQGATVFDVRKAVTDGLERFGFPSVKEWSAFVKNALLNPLSGSSALGIVAPPEVATDPVFRVAFFYFLGNDPVEAEISVFYQKEIDVVPRSQIKVSRLSGTNPYVMMGVPIVPIEMMSGHDARFDDMRKVYASFRRERRELSTW